MATVIVRLFRAAIESMGLGDVLKDPRFEKAPTLMPEEREELRMMVLQRGLEKTKDEWMDVFVNQTSNVAAEPFHTTQQGLSHPQVVHTRHVVEVDDPRVGAMKQLGVLVRMSDTPGSVKGPAPDLGQHTEEVLAKLESAPPRNGNGASSSAALPAHPLEGITLLDLSTVIAGPLACSLTYELGVRVIHLETLEGDTMRRNFDGLGGNRTQAGAENLSINLPDPGGEGGLSATGGQGGRDCPQYAAGRAGAAGRGLRAGEADQPQHRVPVRGRLRRLRAPLAPTGDATPSAERSSAGR